MDDRKKQLTIFGKGGGGGGSTSWGQITGTLSNQTDLQNALDTKADSSSVPTSTSDLNNDSGYITLSDVPAQVQADWNQSDNTQVDFIKNKPTLGTMASESASDYTPTSGLATVATSGSYSDLTNTPTIPAAQIQSDWNQSDNTQVDFIKNKPTIPTVNDNTITIQKNGTTVDSFTTNASSGKTINISGVQNEITSSNKLSADLVEDGSTNKVFTATEQSKLSGIAAGAEVNVQSDWNVTDTSSDAYIVNKPTIPTVNDATITLQDDGGTTIDSFTLNQSSNKTITIPSSGGGGSQWFGTQTQFDNLGTYDDDTDYYISDKLDYNTDIKNKPDLSSYATKTEVNTKNAQQDGEIAGKLSGHFMTQQEFDALGNNVPEGENYFIEGSTVQMVVTFTDQTTATYNVVVD